MIPPLGDFNSVQLSLTEEMTKTVLLEKMSSPFSIFCLVPSTEISFLKYATLEVWLT